MYLYETTIGEYSVAGRYSNAFASDLRVPKGEDWELVNSCAADGLIIWTWKKYIGEE